ncbi:45248_t:CDS:2, partial [Gigaspora margarita]
MPSRKRTNPRHARATNKVHSWSAKEKLIVIYYLEHTNNTRATAKHFDIEPKQVPQYLLLEEKLIKWIEELRNMHNAVTRNMLLDETNTSNENTEEALDFDNID